MAPEGFFGISGFMPPVRFCVSNSFTKEVVGAIGVPSALPSIVRDLLLLLGCVSSAILIGFKVFRSVRVAGSQTSVYMSSSFTWTSELSTERRGDGNLERVVKTSEVAVALLAARNERPDPLSFRGAGEGRPEVSCLAAALRSLSVSSQSKSASSINVVVPELMEERRVEEALLTDFAADRAPLVPPALDVLDIGGVFGAAFANARADAMRAALGTLCGVDERDVLLERVGEAVAVVMEDHAAICRVTAMEVGDRGRSWARR